MKNIYNSRREFIMKSACGALCAGLVPPLFLGCTEGDAVVNGGTPKTITIDITENANSALQAAGGSIFISDPNDSARPIIVYRESDSEINAFSSRCTHQGGPVGLINNGKGVCAWHASEFDIEGEVIKGPATSNLKAFAAVLNGNIITITL